MQVKKLKNLIADIQSVADALDDSLEIDQNDLDDVITIHGQIRDQIKPLQEIAEELEEIRESVDQIWIAIETAQDEA
jgi:methyl-accepting chemotaxis protein